MEKPGLASVPGPAGCSLLSCDSDSVYALALVTDFQTPDPAAPVALNVPQCPSRFLHLPARPTPVCCFLSCFEMVLHSCHPD